MHALLLHAPVEGSGDSELWWIESSRVARLLPSHGVTLFFVYANGRVGSSVSEAMRPVHPATETLNGYLFRQ